MADERKSVAWSHSSLKSFQNCGKQYYETRVAKNVKQKKTEELIWGERGHKVAEHRLLTGEELTEEFAYLEPVMKRLAQTKGEVNTEQKLAITSSFKPTTWFGPDVWCRGVLDAVWLDGDAARIIDWKFGKRKLDSNQLRLFALLYFAHHPEVERINTAFVWLKTGQMDVEKFRREEVPALWQDILPDIRRLEYAHKTMTFIPRPSGLCNWCPVRGCSFWISEDGTGNQRGRT